MWEQINIYFLPFQGDRIKNHHFFPWRHDFWCIQYYPIPVRKIPLIYNYLTCGNKLIYFIPFQGERIENQCFFPWQPDLLCIKYYRISVVNIPAIYNYLTCGNKLICIFFHFKEIGLKTTLFFSGAMIFCA